MNQGFIGVCARDGVEERGSWREKRGTSVFWVFSLVTIGERQEELICIVISLVPSSKLSLLPTNEKKYPGENLFYCLHNTGIVKPISYPGQVEK